MVNTRVQTVEYSIGSDRVAVKGNFAKGCEDLWRKCFQNFLPLYGRINETTDNWWHQ